MQCPVDLLYLFLFIILGQELTKEATRLTGLRQAAKQAANNAQENVRFQFPLSKELLYGVTDIYVHTLAKLKGTW